MIGRNAWRSARIWSLQVAAVAVGSLGFFFAIDGLVLQREKDRNAVERYKEAQEKKLLGHLHEIVGAAGDACADADRAEPPRWAKRRVWCSREPPELSGIEKGAALDGWPGSRFFDAARGRAESPVFPFGAEEWRDTWWSLGPFGFLEARTAVRAGPVKEGWFVAAVSQPLAASDFPKYVMSKRGEILGVAASVALAAAFVYLVKAGVFDPKTQEKIHKERLANTRAIGHDLGTVMLKLKQRAAAIDDEALRERTENDFNDMSLAIESVQGVRPEEARLYDLATLAIGIADEEADAGNPVRYTGPERLAVDCQPVSMRRALANMVANALRYAGEAEIRLRPLGGRVRLEVADRGPGIPRDQREAMFEPFRRGDPSRNRETGGSGLGLFVVWAVARNHGGKAELLPREGGGLIVRLTIPAHAGGSGVAAA